MKIQLYRSRTVEVVCEVDIMSTSRTTGDMIVKVLDVQIFVPAYGSKEKIHFWHANARDVEIPEFVDKIERGSYYIVAPSKMEEGLYYVKGKYIPRHIYIWPFRLQIPSSLSDVDEFIDKLLREQPGAIKIDFGGVIINPRSLRGELREAWLYSYAWRKEEEEKKSNDIEKMSLEELLKQDVDEDFRFANLVFLEEDEEENERTELIYLPEYMQE